MRTIFILFIILVQSAFADTEAGLFGLPDAAPSLSINTMDGGATRLITARRNKEGVTQYGLRAALADGRKIELPLTKEDFTKCYLLASHAFREFHRSPPGPVSKIDLRSVWISMGAEQAMVMYDVGALPENPLLGELLTFLDVLTKQP